ncbi:related to Histone deacetylase clr3 [Armillaria ostoyae]|uniref:histone deacetylase n=1 Tax=Armillaria ostoyae TaxID=47428 RepID=A0A284QMD6_ARMOS|nr:related to Histone deacetylase clr3 [Armillaria ostoyae]
MDAGPSVSRLTTANNDARPPVQTSGPLRPSSPKGPRASSVPLVPSEFTVGVVYSTEMTSHFSLQDHPEQPARISHIWHTLIVNKCNTKMKWLPIRPVHKQEALLVHSEDHWDKRSEQITMLHLDMTPQQIVDSEAYYETLSLYVMQGTTRSALLSCGGVIEACLAVAASDSSLKKALAIVRPPGHHAEPNEHMGFCFFNNVSVAARVVQERLKLKRILILDWDVHHGNGTQKAFNNDPSVLYISLHRYEDGRFYPCGTFGGMQSCGEGPGLGFSVNIPWPEKGMKDADYIHAFQKIVMPIAMEFAPQLVIISAGFDAAEGDELGECHVSPAGYAHMTHMLSGLASGKVVVALEGGYNINAIAKSALAVTQVLLGEAPPELPPMTAGESATETVWLVAKEQSKYWKSVDPKAYFERATFSIPEILKAHRQHYLFTNYDMMQIPLLSDYLDDRFSMQIMCTPDLLDNKTMVIFIHEFGNLRTELESSATCNLELERSYLVDFSKDFIAWVKKQGYSLLDINQFPKPFAAPTRRSQTPKDPTKEVLVYLWDNYVQLSNAERVVLVGHGPGCQSMIDLVDHRWMLGNKLIKAVVQVVGNSKVPTVPKSDEFKAWYTKHSLVAVPSSHPVYGNTSQGKRDLRRHHHVIAIDETQPIKLIIKALPAIQDYVQMELARYPLKNATARTNNVV